MVFDFVNQQDGRLLRPIPRKAIVMKHFQGQPADPEQSSRRPRTGIAQINRHGIGIFVICRIRRLLVIGQVVKLANIRGVQPQRCQDSYAIEVGMGMVQEVAHIRAGYVVVRPRVSNHFRANSLAASIRPLDSVHQPDRRVVRGINAFSIPKFSAQQPEGGHSTGAAERPGQSRGRRSAKFFRVGLVGYGGQFLANRPDINHRRTWRILSRTPPKARPIIAGGQKVGRPVSGRVVGLGFIGIVFENQIHPEVFPPVGNQPFVVL